MALNRGVKALKPCPICHVPHNQLSKIDQIARLRTSSESRMCYYLSSYTRTKKAQETRLKAMSLRPVVVRS